MGTIKSREAALEKATNSMKRELAKESREVMAGLL